MLAGPFAVLGASLWGLLEADPTAVGVLVALVVVGAVAYVGSRLLGRRGRG